MGTDPIWSVPLIFWKNEGTGWSVPSFCKLLAGKQGYRSIFDADLYPLFAEKQGYRSIKEVEAQKRTTDQENGEKGRYRSIWSVPLFSCAFLLLICTNVFLNCLDLYSAFERKARVQIKRGVQIKESPQTKGRDHLKLWEHKSEVQIKESKETMGREHGARAC